MFITFKQIKKIVQKGLIATRRFVITCIIVAALLVLQDGFSFLSLRDTIRNYSPSSPASPS
jgi:hypothetical protein